MSQLIESAIQANAWARARRLITAALRREPLDHWLLTRLSLTYYKQRRYREALALEKRALAIAPNCPLVLWDYAGTLQMLDRHREALAIYRRITRIPLERLAHGTCGEGLARARGLHADCFFGMSTSYRALGRSRMARQVLARHLSLRGPGCHSIYSRREALARLNDLTTRAA